MPLNSGFVLECSRSIQMTDTAQFHTVDVDADGFDPLAQRSDGFSDEAQDLLSKQMMTTTLLW